MALISDSSTGDGMPPTPMNRIKTGVVPIKAALGFLSFQNRYSGNGGGVKVLPHSRFSLNSTGARNFSYPLAPRQTRLIVRNEV